MRKLITLSALVLIAVFTVSAVPQKPQTWEYKFQFQCDEKKANNLGAEGWEIVNMTSSGVGMATAVNCAFKRPR